MSFAFSAGDSVGDAISTIEASSTLTAAGISVSGGAGSKLVFSSTAAALGDGFEVKFGGSSLHDDTMLGLQGGDVAAASRYYSEVSNGAFQLAAGATTTVLPLPWTDQWGGDSQTITILASDTSGNTHPLPFTLTSAWNRTGTGSSVDAAINAINNALQASNDSTLQQVVAVKSQNAGMQTIQFVSTLNNFTVSVGSNSSAGAGLNSTQASGTTFHSVKAGAGGTADISTIANAQNAVAAITAAVGLLGAAQASVGRGQNQLNFAIDLAHSQITNFATAQSIVRDADEAQQAANLTKAQVLEQASIAAMAQANSAPQAVLTLLRG
jgi:flagellin